jgi:ESF2/ABP1 family protein
MKKPGSILRIKEFSESEDDDAGEEMAVDQSDSESIEDLKQESESEGIEDLLEEDDDDQPGTSKSLKLKDKQKKKGKKGIIYISSIPKHMNVAICREFLERFGDVGRVFLQPDSKGSKLGSLSCLVTLTNIQF